MFCSSPSTAGRLVTHVHWIICSPIALSTLVMAGVNGAAARDLIASSKPGLYSPEAAQQSRPLRVEVLDGTSFREIETGAIYKLYGIDTCAPLQRATLGRQPWPCGTMATAWLVTATLNKWVACNTIVESDRVNFARCASSQHPDLAADMVRDGVAVTVPASPQQPVIRAYAALEQDARKAYRGIWASSFQMPWEFRAAATASPKP